MKTNTQHPWRVRFLIDGFNVYHAIDEYNKKFLWINYKKLASQLIYPNQVIEKLLYFTAIAHWKPDAAQRHELYIRTLEAEGIETIRGNFKKKDRECRRCHWKYTRHEEKESDVNLAIHLVKGALKNEFDVAILMTADSDLVPAIEMAKQEAPQIKIGVCFPIKRWSADLNKVTDFIKRTSKSMLKKSQLDDPYVLPDGKPLSKPVNWV